MQKINAAGNRPTGLVKGKAVPYLWPPSARAVIANIPGVSP